MCNSQSILTEFTDDFKEEYISVGNVQKAEVKGKGNRVAYVVVHEKKKAVQIKDVLFVPSLM